MMALNAKPVAVGSRARLSLETAHDGGADHAGVASYEYAFLGHSNGVR